MNQAFAKKRIVKSLALSLMLGSISFYLAQSPAHAAKPGTTETEFTVNSVEKSVVGQHKHQGLRWPIVEEAAAVLGMDKEALTKALKGGKSIVDIAAEKGISEADLTAKLQTLRSSKIDEAVKKSNLTAEKAEHMKNKLSKHLKFVLNDKNLFNHMDKHHPSHKIN